MLIRRLGLLAAGVVFGLGAVAALLLALAALASRAAARRAARVPPMEALRAS